MDGDLLARLLGGTLLVALLGIAAWLSGRRVEAERRGRDAAERLAVAERSAAEALGEARTDAADRLPADELRRHHDGLARRLLRRRARPRVPGGGDEGGG